MCCLSYENDYYAEVSKKMPKMGGEVGTPEGKATVINLDMLRLQATVKREDGAGGFVYKTYPVSELNFKKSNQIEKDEDDDKDKL